MLYTPIKNDDFTTIHCFCTFLTPKTIINWIKLQFKSMFFQKIIVQYENNWAQVAERYVAWYAGMKIPAYLAAVNQILARQRDPRSDPNWPIFVLQLLKQVYFLLAHGFNCTTPCTASDTSSSKCAIEKVSTSFFGKNF